MLKGALKKQIFKQAQRIRRNNIPDRFKGMALLKPDMLELRLKYLELQKRSKQRRERNQQQMRDFNAGVTRRQQLLKTARRAQLRELGVIK